MPKDGGAQKALCRKAWGARYASPTLSERSATHTRITHPKLLNIGSCASGLCLVFFFSPLSWGLWKKLYSSPTMQSVLLLLALILLGSASAQVTIEPVSTRVQTNQTDCERCSRSLVVALQTLLRSIFGTNLFAKAAKHVGKLALRMLQAVFISFFGPLDALSTKTPHPPHKSKAPRPKLMLSLPCNRSQRSQQASAFTRQLLRIMCLGSTSECCIYFVAMSWSHVS